MAFIVKKKINGKDYYYLNQAKRFGKKVVSKYIAYLGKDKNEAEKKAKKILKDMEKDSKGIKMKNNIKVENKPFSKRFPKDEMEEKSNLVKKEISVEEMAVFCKRKGFAYPSAEIYGGLAGLYDYGHLGSLLKKNFENIWRNFFLGLDDNFAEIESSEILPEKAFIASGHLKNFNDCAAKCKKGHIERADHLLEKNLKERFEGLTPEELFNKIKDNKIVCSTCGSQIEFVEVTNMMFPLQLGFANNIKTFLRPETAQSPYVNFKIQSEVMRKRLPLGLALIGRAYRNELSPRNFLLRQRAFTQAELQIFFNPSKIDEHELFDEIKDYSLIVVLSDNRDKGIQRIKCGDLLKKIPKFYVYYLAKVQQFYLDLLKFPEDKFRFYQLNDQEKAFYNKYHFDMEANLDALGWTEIGGIHYRTDHDLKGHQEISKENLSFFDEDTKEKFIPHVLELSFGVDRNFYSILNFSYYYDEKRQNIVLKLLPKLSPIKAAVFPIIKKEEFENLSEEIVKDLKKEFNVIYDISGSIGRRYSRNDEIGTPLCITVDEKSVVDDSVTVRDRDTTEQIRVKIKNLKEIIKKVVEGENILDFGKSINTRKK